MSHRIPICVAFFLIAVPVWAAPPDREASASCATAQGLVVLNLRWAGPVPLAAGDVLTCRARIVPLMRGAQGRTGEVSVVVPGPAGGCALEVPLVWRDGVAPGEVTLVYQMDAVTAEGSLERKTGTLRAGAAAALRLTIMM